MTTSITRVALYALETRFVPPPEEIRVMRVAAYALEMPTAITGLFAFHNDLWQDVQPFVKLAAARATEADDIRVTEAGDARVLEPADADNGGWVTPSATYIRHDGRWRRVLPPLVKGQTDG